MMKNKYYYVMCRQKMPTFDKHSFKLNDLPHLIALAILCLHHSFSVVGKIKEKAYALGGEVLKLVIIKSHKNKTTILVFGFIVFSISLKA
jgi:hypothetical protein